MSNITVFEQSPLCIDYEQLAKQQVQLNFVNGKVEYFSISTQWNTTDSIEDALRDIITADSKYYSKSPYQYYVLRGSNNV